MNTSIRCLSASLITAFLAVFASAAEITNYQLGFEISGPLAQKYETVAVAGSKVVNSSITSVPFAAKDGKVVYVDYGMSMTLTSTVTADRVTVTLDYTRKTPAGSLRADAEPPAKELSFTVSNTFPLSGGEAVVIESTPPNGIKVATRENYGAVPLTVTLRVAPAPSANKKPAATND